MANTKMDLDICKISKVFAERRTNPILKMRYYAILALLTEKNGELCFVLNKRAANVRQPGDICFPGGHKEKDESLKDTALRETCEELGVPQERIRILGKSDYMTTIYHGIIQPYLGFVDYCQLRSSRPNPDEVAQIFTVPVSYFLKTPPEIHNLVWEVGISDTFPYDRIQGGKAYPFGKSKIPELFYEYKGHHIWGLTAQVIQNICTTLEANNMPKQ